MICAKPEEAGTRAVYDEDRPRRPLRLLRRLIFGRVAILIHATRH